MPFPTTADGKKFSGNVREVISIALPMVVALACDTVMVFTDRFMLSKISPELMNAALGGGMTAFMMSTFFIGLIGYSTALVAQYLGAGRKDFCAKVTTQAVLIAICGYPLIMLCRPLAHALFEAVGVPASQLVYQIHYLDILVSGAVIGLLRNSLSAFFSGIGRTKVVMIAACCAMASNIFFNYVLIFGKFGFPSLGITGAAYGTILGSSTGFAVLLVAYLRKSVRREFFILRAFVFNSEAMRKLLRFGYPAGLEMFLNMLAFNVLAMIFQSMGPVTATASSIMFNWDMVSFVPLVGVEIGVTSLVGRAMGGGSPDLAHKCVMSGLKLGLVFSAIIFVLFTGFPEILVRMFAPSSAGAALFEESVPLAVFMVRVASLYVLVEALFIVFIGALRGAGDTLWAMALTVSLHWAMTLTAFFMLKVWGTSAGIAWSAVVILFFLSAAFVYKRYTSGEWKKIRVVEVAPPPELIVDTFHERVDL